MGGPKIDLRSAVASIANLRLSSVLLISFLFLCPCSGTLLSAISINWELDMDSTPSVF